MAQNPPRVSIAVDIYRLYVVIHINAQKVTLYTHVSNSTDCPVVKLHTIMKWFGGKKNTIYIGVSERIYL